MTTFLEAFCTHEDMQSILPSLGEYNRNTVLTTWAIHSGSVYKSASSGRVDVLYRDGNELTSVTDLASVDSDGEYFYDSSADVVFLFSNANPQTNHTIEAGKDFSDTVNEAKNRASEICRSIVSKPIYKKIGVGYQGESTRNYDEVIILSTAAIAVALMVRPFDMELADDIEERYNSEEDPRGMLQLVRDGFIKLHHEFSADRSQGLITPVNINGSSTGSIVDIQGDPSKTDILRIEITTGGTLSYGTASSIVYKVLAGNNDGLQTQEIVTGETLTGGYDTLGFGTKFKGSQGVYTAGDYWFVDMVAGIPETQNPIRTTKAMRY
ncbi:MAG: hypothetical protein Tp1111SUR768151_8 [Prokaryotic dsDNA virus sp.]|nr:MAG: hypothetical protein Tp1111SUR768151_8 [Prokaryotic dsDNA virus sp.]|tara:strand:+ start:2011 stop:2982 length:972 start_codon:yes stop_codon:yes gene_type:complete